MLKVAVGALKSFPKLNASVDMANEEIIYKNYYHLGVAVDTERGLLVPVIRNVDQKSIFELAAELSDIAEKTREGKIAPAEMEGATFTITNLGGIGSTNFTPIINPPQVAILGIAQARMEPVFDKQHNTFKPRLILPLALSYDHRLVDGADAARVLEWIKTVLEEPMRLSLQA